MKNFNKNNQHGSIFAFFACMLPIIMIIGSLVVDLGRGYVRHSSLQNVADAAALAGVAKIEHSDTAHLVSSDAVTGLESNDKSSADAAAVRSLNGNFYEGSPDTELLTDYSNNAKIYYYNVTISEYVPLSLA